MLFAVSAPVVLGQEYSSKSTFFPVATSYQRIFSTVRDLEVLLAQSNGAPPSATVIIRAQYDDDAVEAASLDQFKKAVEQLPTANSFSYSYYCRSCSAVTEVQLELRDHSRSLSIEGPSHQHVEAISSMMARNIGDWQVYVGGPLLRIESGMFAAMGALICVPVVIFSHRSRQWRIAVIAAAATLLAIVLLPPWTSVLLAGVRISREPSVLVRYAGEMALLGIVLGAVSLFFDFWKPRSRGKGSPTNSTLAETPPTTP